MENRKLIFVNVCYILALLLVIAPLLIVAEYNYPSADDWSFGKGAYQAIQSGAGIGSVLMISIRTAARNYVNWEGRFVSAFFASLQPGIWGESCYRLVTWLMLGGMAAGELFLFRILFRGHDKSNRFLWFSMIMPSLILQILYTPSVVESFYWYTGSVNYTFVYGLSMILIGLFVRLGMGDLKGWKFGIAAVGAGVLAVMVGGNNYSTSLSSFLFMAVFYIWTFVSGKTGMSDSELSGGGSLRRVLARTWYIAALTGGSLLVCVLAPGNRARLEENFGGSTTGSALQAVGQSLWRSFTNICSWTNGKIILMIVLILPFAWMAVRRVSYDFRWPGIFTLLSFGLYASQITPTLYVDGTVGGGRMAAILYYSYHVWIVGNVCYWTGWLCRVRERWPAFMARLFGALGPFVRRFLIPYCAVVGVVLAAVIYKCDLKEISSYRAYRDLRQGWAQQYALEWERRLEVLHDESITQVEFEPLSVYPGTILYTDLQDEKGYTWVNSACARYYDKEYIRIVEQGTEDK